MERGREGERERREGERERRERGKHTQRKKDILRDIHTCRQTVCKIGNQSDTQ